MFWSGNYIVVRELNFLLKEENVSLAQVLEADDILQECKADNKALIQFLTKPEILAELVSLITEEPRGDVELTAQYRHASAACEVLTSQLAALADRLSLDATLMHKLCDFINKEPPLNPLLASYFSKTVEMLLERSPKQDWYLYHIVCLRVLDFFKSRRDFLPNLLRHLATSAIADTFKCFVRLDDLFNKTLMEWLEEHQFLENLIAIVCGSYVPETLSDPAPAPATVPSQEKADTETSEKDTKQVMKGDGEETATSNQIPNNVQSHSSDNNNPEPTNKSPADGQPTHAERAERLAAVASANAAALLTDLILNGCALEGANTRPRTAWVLVSRLQSEAFVRLLLQTMFTSPPHLRHCALANGSIVLLALLTHEPILAGEAGVERTGVERAVAPHLPLLHQALLTPPTPPSPPRNTVHEKSKPAEGDKVPQTPVGWPRVRVAALIAQLAVCEADDVPSTLLTLGTPGVLCDLFFQHPDNNFLHAEVYTMVKNALNNAPYKLLYAKHLLVECDLLTRLMDVYEENENKKATGHSRSSYMGHVILLLRRISRALTPNDSPDFINQLGLPDEVLARWTAFDDTIKKVAQQHDTPLGGYYPSESVYEVDVMAENMGLETSYEIGDIGNELQDDNIYSDDPNEMLSGQHPEQNEDFSDVGGTDKMASSQNCFLELVRQRFGDNMWDDSPEEEQSHADVTDVLASVPPWEQAQVSGAGGEGWADFGSDPFASAPADAFAAPTDPFASAPADAFAAPTDPFASNAAFATTDWDFKVPATSDEKSDTSFAPCADNEMSDSDFTPFLCVPPPAKNTTLEQNTDPQPNVKLFSTNDEKILETNVSRPEIKTYASALKTDTSDINATEVKSDVTFVNSHASLMRTDVSNTDVAVVNTDRTVTVMPAAAIDDNAVSEGQLNKFWTGGNGASDSTKTLQEDLSSLHLGPPTSLASNLLTAMSTMTPAEIANIVNANTGGETSDTNIPSANVDCGANIDSGANFDDGANIDCGPNVDSGANIDSCTNIDSGMETSDLQTDES